MGMKELQNGDGKQFGGGDKPTTGSEFKVLEATKGKVDPIPSIGTNKKSGGYTAADQK